MKRPLLFTLLTVCCALGITLGGCKNKGSGAGNSSPQTISNIGSDTMVNLAQAWAEAYHSVDPNISVEVAGGGSGVGVAALINGTCDIANSSRRLEPEEIEKFKAKHNGTEPKEYLCLLYTSPSPRDS